MATNAHSCVIIDRSGQHPPRAGWTLVQTPAELLALELEGPLHIWIAGPGISEWASRLFREKGVQIKDLNSPHELLRGLGIDPAQLDQTVQRLCLDAIAKWETAENNLGLLLAELTGLPVYSGQASPDHLKSWLFTGRVRPKELLPLIAKQVENWATSAQEQDASLALLYRNSLKDPENVARQWLGITAEEDWPGSLPVFPGPIPEQYRREWRDNWSRQLRVSMGEAIRRILDTDRIGAGILAELGQVALNYFQLRREQLTPTIQRWLLRILPADQIENVFKTIILVPPEPFNPQAKIERNLEWAQEWIKYKNQQILRGDEDLQSSDQDVAFGRWLINNYSTMMAIPAAESPFILSIAHSVRRWMAESPILWIIVDGLNLINYEYLIGALSKNEQQPLFPTQTEFKCSLLPTITEINKAALLSGKRPSDVWQTAGGELSTLVSDVWGDVFYASSSESVDQLKDSIGSRSRNLYIWNFTRLDHTLHKSKVRFDIENDTRSILDNLAKRIADLLSVVPDDSPIRVVISSDHGQVLGGSPRVSVPVKGGSCQGRALVGVQWEDPDKAFVYDEATHTAYISKDSFFLSEHVAVLVGPGCWGAWEFDAANRAYGVHGGASPGEVLVGCALLERQSAHRPPLVEIGGSANAGGRGILEIRIDNPMRMPLDHLILCIVVGDVTHDIMVPDNVGACDCITYSTELQPWPSPRRGQQHVELRWVLEYTVSGNIPLRAEGKATLSSTPLYSATPLSLEEFNE